MQIAKYSEYAIDLNSYNDDFAYQRFKPPAQVPTVKLAHRFGIKGDFFRPITSVDKGYEMLAETIFELGIEDLKNAYATIEREKKYGIKAEIRHAEEHLEGLKDTLANGMFAVVSPIPVEDICKAFENKETLKQLFESSVPLSLDCDWAEDKVRQKMKKQFDKSKKTFAETAKETGVGQTLLRIVCEGGVTHPNIAKKLGGYFGLNELETEELMPPNRRKHSEDYDPSKYKTPVYQWRSVFQMKKEVDFARYCAICKYKDRPENDDPCNECLEHGCNEDSKKPINFKERK